MSTVKKLAYAFAGVFISAALLSGCSDDKEVKPAQKKAATQEQIAKDAAQEIRKPIEAATNAREQVEGKEKKKLEGC